MPRTAKTSSRRSDRVVLDRELAEAADETLMQAVVSGCALVAYADGWVKPEEHKRMNGLIRAFEPIKAFGVHEVLAAFDAATEFFERDAVLAERHALERIALLMHNGAYPDLLVWTCLAIANADGDFDAEERAGLIKICGVLELDPADYDLTEAA